jgi:lipoyl(octanoyl) transferase
VTYHGPGQLLIYPLLDLRRHVLNVRQLVVALENAVIAYVAGFGVVAAGRRDAPGVYVDSAKLASIGLRIRRGASYHGMSLNVATDLQPFELINVCGYRGLAVTRLQDLSPVATAADAAAGLTPHLLRELGFEAAGAQHPAQSAINTDLQAVSSR